jgi:hypothetical protein
VRLRATVETLKDPESQSGKAISYAPAYLDDPAYRARLSAKGLIITKVPTSYAGRWADRTGTLPPDPHTKALIAESVWRMPNQNFSGRGQTSSSVNGWLDIDGKDGAHLSGGWPLASRPTFDFGKFARGVSDWESRMEALVPQRAAASVALDDARTNARLGGPQTALYDAMDRLGAIDAKIDRAAPVVLFQPMPAPANDDPESIKRVTDSLLRLQVQVKASATS